MDRYDRGPRDDGAVSNAEAAGPGEVLHVSEAPIGPPRRIELREEELVAHRQREEIGEVRVRTVVDDVPSRVMAEVTHDEVVVERVPVNQEVDQRHGPWEEDGAQVIPVYEERLVLVKQLILKEKVTIRRVEVAETRPIETTVRRERVVVDASDGVVVHDEGPTTREESPVRADRFEQAPGSPHGDQPSPLEKVVRKFLA